MDESITKRDMGGCIYWKDGRYYNLRYKYVYLRTTFEPVPKRNKPAWSVW